MNYPTYDPEPKPQYDKGIRYHCQICNAGFRSLTKLQHVPLHQSDAGGTICGGSEHAPKEYVPTEVCPACKRTPDEGHAPGCRDVPMKRTTQSFETGAIRDSDKEERYDLVVPGPLRKLAIHFGRGAEKYEERNWEKGIPLMRMYASAFRHIQAWVSGEDIDHDETMQNPEHLVAALWNIYCMIELSQTHPELDDRPKRPEGCGVCGESPCKSPVACASARD